MVHGISMTTCTPYACHLCVRIVCIAISLDMIQEVASQGLVLIYELSESSQKESLVEILVGTLMEGRKANQPISGDSKVFEEKSIGKTPTG